MIRKASVADLKMILEIHNSQSDYNSSDGFMLSSKDEESLSRELHNDNNIFYLIEDQAYVKLTKFHDARILNDELSLSIDKEELLKCTYLNHVCVKRGEEGKGLASKIYSFLEKNGYKKLYCFIMDTPHRNTASIEFHRKKGFLEKGSFKSEDFGGFKPYQSKLFVKK